MIYLTATTSSGWANGDSLGPMSPISNQGECRTLVRDDRASQAEITIRRELAAADAVPLKGVLEQGVQGEQADRV